LDLQDVKPEKTLLDSQGDILANCLQIICRFHHVECSIATLLSGLPLESGKLSPSGVERAAAKVGFSSRLIKRKLMKINTALLPAILVLQDGQACVLMSLDNEQNVASVIFPELPEVTEEVSYDQLMSQCSEHVIFIRPHNKGIQREDILPVTRQKSWFWDVVKSASSLYRDVILASVFITLLSVAIPLFVMNVYDRVVPNAAIETLWVLAIGVGIVLIAEFSLRALRYYFVELAASRIDVTLSSVLMQKVMAISFKEKPASSGGQVNSLQSFEAVRGFLNSITLVALVDLPFSFIFIVIIACINLFLIVPIIVGGIIVLSYAFYIQAIMRSLSVESINVSSQKNSLATETITGFDDVRYFIAQNHIQYEWEKQSIQLSKINAKIRLLGSSVSNLALTLQQIVGGSIMLIGVYLIIDGQITQGGLIAGYLLSSRAMGPLASTAGLIAQFHHAKASLSALNEMMEKEEDISSTKKWNYDCDDIGDIDFQSVNFRYPNQTMCVLSRINCKINRGEKVAILGRNGCGKTSFNRLLLKAYAPCDGLITLGNIDLQQIEPNVLRKKIGYMPQDYNLFSGSLKDNITVFDKNISEHRVLAVLKSCDLLDFVNEHPDGINLNVGEKGCLLSGGKRQAVALARALIRDPSIYILDEPTSSMDTSLELKIKNMLADEIQGKTLILNTHRTSLLSLVDRIIVLDKGNILIDGPKNEVLSKLSAIQNKTQSEKG